MNIKGETPLAIAKKLFLILISLSLHIVAIFILWQLWQPIKDWYLSQEPIRGVDLYNSATFVKYLQNYFTLPFSGWMYSSYQGNPFILTYPFLYFYPMLAAANYYGLITGIQMFSILAAFLIGVFSYFLFYELSKNRILAAILALGVLFSVNIYKALVWAGGIPYFTSEAILPLSLYLLVKYKKTRNFKYFLLSATVTGLGILGHPQPVVIYALPAAFILILLWADQHTKFISFRKIKELLLYFFITFLLGSSVFSLFFGQTILAVISSVFNIFNTKSVPSYGSEPVIKDEVKQWALSQVNLIWTQTNQIIWIITLLCLLVFLATIIFQKSKIRAIWNFFIFALPAAGVIVSVMLYARGFIQFIGGWYKVFWAVPILVGMYASFLWGSAASALSQIGLFNKPVLSLARKFINIAVCLAIFIASLYLFQTYTQNTVKEINKGSMSSSSYPTSLNSSNANLREKTLSQTLPSWFPKNEKNYRFYEIDATVNVWWNSLIDMPLARGYIDPPIQDKGSMFWLNATMGRGREKAASSLEEDWKVPHDVVLNNLLYLLDWQAIKYFEGNHASQATSALINPDILSDKFLQKQEIATVSGNFRPTTTDGLFLWQKEGKEELTYFEMKDDFISPIMYSTNAPSVLIIGNDTSYDNMGRFFGELNLNSQNLIFVRGPKYIDDVDLKDMLNFDLVILYGYDYHNHGKAWSMIEAYLKNGGSLFIDTGPEVKESSSTTLPNNFSKELPGVFPINQTVRKGMGYDWNAKINLPDFGKNVDVQGFSKLDFDGAQWQVSFPPEGSSDLTEGAQVVLTNQDKPVVVQGTNFGGKVIWSGLNLPYHVIRNHNKDESQFMVNILEYLIPIKRNPPVNTNISWQSPQKRSIQVSQAKGVIFKEQQYSGWSAKTKEGQNLTIFPAGPTFPGFMYVSLPKETRSTEVMFEYKGEPKYKTYSYLAIITLIFIFDFVFLGGNILGRLLRFVWGKLSLKTSKWWEKDEVEEY